MPEDKRIIGAGVCAGGMVNPNSDDLLPQKPVKHPKTREEWKNRRDWCELNGSMHEAEWIDRKILYPIGNIINGKYPDDEIFKCKCGSHVAINHGGIFDNITECVVCGQGIGVYIGQAARKPWNE